MATTETVCENEGTVSRNTRFTKLVTITMGCTEMVALIDPEADLTDTFKCFDIDCNEWLRVRGWLAEVNDYERG